MEWQWIIIQGIGLLGILMGWLALQCNKHNRVLVFKMTEEGLFGIQYLLLGGYTGAVLNLVGTLRNMIFFHFGKQQKEKELKVARRLLAVLLAILGFLSWQGYISLLIIAAKVVSTLAYGTTNLKKMRLMICFTCICWICYNIYVGSITGIVSDSGNLLSTIISIIRHDIFGRKIVETVHNNEEEPIA